MRELTLTIQTLTPIWTGGAEGKMDRLHETGIIGSLRWWYEVIVRGLGGHACDPTENPCELDGKFDSEKYKKTNDVSERAGILREAGLCDACQVFGATGWKRRFRIVGDDHELEKDTTTSLRNLKGNPFIGNFTLKLIPQSNDFNPALLLGILKLIENVGGLGAKPQMGFGNIKVLNSSFSPKEFVENITITPAEASDQGLPDLREMFFCNLDDSDPLEEQKKALREPLTEIGDEKLLKFVCGSTESGGKVFYSQVKENETRVWGWIPELDKGIQYYQERDEVVDFISDKFWDTLQKDSWIEFHSDRDKKHEKSSPKEFLLDLLQGDDHD